MMSERRKDQIISTIGASVIVVAIFLIMGIVGTIETHYKAAATVITADPYNDITVYMVNNGECYSTDFNCEVYIGDEVELTMFNNYTDGTILDDEIKKVKITKKY